MHPPMHGMSNRPVCIGRAQSAFGAIRQRRCSVWYRGDPMQQQVRIPTVSLQESDLLSEAENRARGTDWGNYDFKKAFRTLLHCIQEEAQLSLIRSFVSLRMTRCDTARLSNRHLEMLLTACFFNYYDYVLIRYVREELPRPFLQEQWYYVDCGRSWKELFSSSYHLLQ